MRLRGMDQAEAGSENNVQSHLDYMPEVHDALNDALGCAGLGYGSGTVWSNDLVSTTQIYSIGNGFARVA